MITNYIKIIDDNKSEINKKKKNLNENKLKNNTCKYYTTEININQNQHKLSIAKQYNEKFKENLKDNKCIIYKNLNEQSTVKLTYNKDLFKKNYKFLKKTKYKNIFKDKSIRCLIKLIIIEIHNDHRYIKRLAKEFKLIKKNNFIKVFIQVLQILKLANTLYITRGSAVSCLLCYYLGISNLDPIKYNCLLERFMHKRRTSIPDIDIDVGNIIRDKILKKIYNSFPEAVGRISNHVYYKERTSIREAIRQHGYKKMIKKNENIEDIFKDKNKIKEVYKTARKLQGKFKNYSRHCAGIILFPNKVPKNLILKKNNFDGITETQLWLNKDQVEDAGMIKLDLLSNAGLSILKNISNKPIRNYDLNDKNVYKLLSSGNIFGIVYAESRSMYKAFTTIQPQNIEEIAIALALIRPAASKNYQKALFLEDYVKYRNIRYDKKKWVIFDDDAITLISKILNCSLSEADLYRRAFKKQNFKLIKEFKIRMNKLNLYSKKEKTKIIERLNSLISYSFCRGHALSYAILVYVLAYHKLYNPVKFHINVINYINSSYRSWVHIRQLINNTNIKISGLGKRPFTLKENKLYPSKGKNLIINDPIVEYKIGGYWTQKSFLPEMYLNKYYSKKNPEQKIKERQKNDKYLIKNKKDEILMCKFRGLIATGRPYKNHTTNKTLTFYTIGYDNEKFIDIVVYGIKPVNDVNVLRGEGIIKWDGYIKWVEVKKIFFDKI